MNQHVRRLIRQLTADKKKLSLMLGLMSVVLLLWGRLLLKQVPRTAVATSPEELAMIDSGNSSSAGGNSSRHHGPRKSVQIVVNKSFTRDMFTMNPGFYTQITLGDQVQITSGKSGLDSADDAPELVLQTTILGDRPRAMINGQIVSVGQEIHGFKVKAIESRSVVLEKNSIEVRLDIEM